MDVKARMGGVALARAKVRIITGGFGRFSGARTRRGTGRAGVPSVCTQPQPFPPRLREVDLAAAVGRVTRQAATQAGDGREPARGRGGVGHG